jgi:ribosomal protein S18 acetylase RimI-like enzyme
MQVQLIGNNYVCEVYAPEEEIPLEFLDEARQMYFEAYLYPPLHEGISIEELGLDQNLFGSYEEYIEDMFRRDFSSYGQPGKPRLHYFQLRSNEDGCLVGVCVVLEKSMPGFYYLDHIGIHWKFRHQGLAESLIKVMINQLGNFIEISLDTRIFNLPAQTLYEKLGFEKLGIHPCPEKQNIYFHYILPAKKP